MHLLLKETSSLLYKAREKEVSGEGSRSPTAASAGSYSHKATLNSGKEERFESSVRVEF